MRLYEQADGAGIRAECGIPPGAPVLVHVGRLAREKNLRYLLGAALRFLAGSPEAHLLIAGEGPMRAEVEQTIRDAGEPGQRAHLLGVLKGRALADAYAAGDLFLFASQTETQGMVLVESMAAGTPVVALDAEGVRDLVRDGVNGRLLPAGVDEAGCAAALMDIWARGDQTIARWRAGARATARQLDMPLLAGRLHGIYRSLKIMPNHRLKRETMSFGLIRSYFETVWEDIETWLNRA